MQDGNGNLGAASTNPLEWGQDEASFKIARADLDGDSVVDLLVGKEDGIHLFKSMDVRGLSFVTNHAFAEANGRCEKLATGDMDNDGDQDVLVTCWSGTNVMFINDGVGGLSQKLDSPFASKEGVNLEIVDVDGDSDLDVFIAGGPLTNGLSNQLFLNDGDAGLTLLPDSPFASATNHEYATLRGDPRSMSLAEQHAGYDISYTLGSADLDGDGDHDIIRCTQTSTLQVIGPA